MEAVETGLHPEELDELPEFRTISATAVIGFILALFSPLVLVRALLIVVPVAAAVTCVLALTRIHRSEGRLMGKTPAVIGLGIACFFAAAVPAQHVAWRRALHARAAPIAMAWLEALQQQKPHVAHQLTKSDLSRRSLTDALWRYYRSDRAAARELQEFVDRPAVRFLLTLGDATEIRPYEPAVIDIITPTTQLVTQHYAVTYDDPDAGRTTFFVAVTLERREATSSAGEQWRVTDFEAGARPGRPVS